LLSDLYSQLWTVLRQYLLDLGATGRLAAPTSGGATLATAVNFLLRLGLQEGGGSIDFCQLSAAEQAIAAQMCHLGLLMPTAAGGALWLHPTRLAAVLAGGNQAGEAAAATEEGYVIVESNFR
jgi:hypothetical protein